MTMLRAKETYRICKRTAMPKPSEAWPPGEPEQTVCTRSPYLLMYLRLHLTLLFVQSRLLIINQRRKKLNEVKTKDSN